MAQILILASVLIGFASCQSGQTINQRGQQGKAVQYQSDLQQIESVQKNYQEKPQTSRCDKRERYPVDGFCDKYLECEKGVLIEKTCPDGLYFNPEVSYRVYPCYYPIDVHCEARTIQSAQPTADCPHQFGYYRLGDAKNCSYFRNCVSGTAFDLQCPEGLAFNSATYRCDWPDEVAECDAEAFLGFKCPPIPTFKELGAPAGWRSYSNQEDCQKYFICVNGSPRIQHCGYGKAYDEVSEACINLPEVLACPESLRLAFIEEEKTRSAHLARLGVKEDK